MTLNFEPRILNSALPGGWDAAETELLSLMTYARGWDGDDAPAIPVQLIQSTLNWLRQLQDGCGVAPDAIAPTFGGTIMLEWFKPGGGVTSAEVRVPGRAEVLDWEPDRSKNFSTYFWTDPSQVDSCTSADAPKGELSAATTSIALDHPG